MIGIIDYDYMTASSVGSPPTLLAMKYSTYLKGTEKKHVRLLTSLTQAEACEKIYFFSDKPLDKIDKSIFTFENCEMFGRYLTNENPDIIDHMIPDIYLYRDDIQDKIVNRKISSQKALQFLDSVYYQVYSNKNARLPIPPSENRKRFYIYDKDLLAHEECWDVLEEITSRSPSGIYFISPLLCHTMKQFLLIREEYEKVSRANRIILDYFVPFTQFEAYFGKYKLKLLGEITKNSDVRIYLGKNYVSNAYTDTFYVKNIFYCLNLLFNYYSRNIPIRAEVYETEENNPYLPVYKAIRSWVNSHDYDLTLQDSLNNSKINIEKYQELVKKESIFNVFLDKSKNNLINTRGFWKIV